MTDSKNIVATPGPADPSIPAGTEEAARKGEKPRGLWGDAWAELRRRPLFVIAAVILLFLLLLAAFPQLFSTGDPSFQDLTKAREDPSGEAWFGYDIYGRDLYTRAIYGARATMVVGVLATVFTVLIGGTIGMLAGFFGGVVDNLLSRFSEVFLGLPFVLGAIVILTTFNANQDKPDGFRITAQVVTTIAVLSWPIAMRIMRSAAISAKQQDYVKAARALGASNTRIILRHLLPNTLAPVLVYATIALGGFIGAEATLSFLGIGLRDPVVSWGVMISESRSYVTTAPHMLLFPAGFLVLTVLSFVMLGDAVRDALDPKQK